MARREQYDDEMMDAEQPQRVRSTVSSVRKQKGRGFRERMDTEDPRNGARGSYETLEAGSGPGPAKCKSLSSTSLTEADINSPRRDEKALPSILPVFTHLGYTSGKTDL